MKKHNVMKKVISGCLIVIIIMITMFPSVYAATSLTCWYSNAPDIGRWTTMPTIAVTSLNNNYTFTEGVHAAASQWSSVLGRSISTVNTSSISTNYGVQIYGGTRSQIESLSIFGSSDFDGNQGLTKFTGYQYDQTYSTPDGTKTGYKLTKVRCFVLETSLSSNEHRNVCLHEISHALGWYGHSSCSSDVMYSYCTSVVELKDRDKMHLEQVY